MFPCSHVPRDFSEIAASPRRLAVIAADSILQREGETISRRHERGCLLNGSGRAYHGVARDSVCLIEAGEPITAARVIRYLSCHEERLYHGSKRASMSTVAARLLLVIESLVYCGYVLAGSVIIFCVCAHYLDRGLWSCPGGFFRHVLGLRSSLGSVFISWIVDCGHVLDGSVVISWVCGHFLTRGLWSCPGWVCGHLLSL